MYERLMDETIQCDLCGEKNPEGEIYKSDDLIYLCPQCLQKLNKDRQGSWFAGIDSPAFSGVRVCHHPCPILS